MGKIIVFDLYDTVLKDITFDFNAGIRYLYDTFFTEKCSWQEMMDYEETFSWLYEKRKTDGSEVCLIRDEIPMFFQKFGVELPEDMEELEYRMMDAAQKVTLPEEVRDTLEKLHGKKIPIYILSNSIFTGQATERLLREFGILDYFEKVYVSADYGVRKPSEKFFQIALEEMQKENPGMEKKDILYVGNDYRTDVGGATAMGFHTIWYNVRHLENTQNIEITEADDFRKILELAE